MRYLIFLSVFILSATCIFAKRFELPHPSYIQKTPFSGMFLDKRMLADKEVYKKFDANGQLIPNGSGTCMDDYDDGITIYHHDPGGLIDTIDGGGCVNIPQILKYSIDGKLQAWEFLSGTFTDFKYDEQGRILSITSGYSRSTIHEEGEIILYDYEANVITSESIRNGASTSSVICRIQYTDSGYVAEYEDDGVIEYVYDKQSRLTRGGDVLYTYTDHGYIKTEGDERTEFIFEEESGYISEIKHYKKELDEWVFMGSSQSSYIFSPTSANEPVIDKDKVYGTYGALMVELLKSSEIAIYSLEGQLVMSQWIEVGEPVSIRLPRGLYIIRTKYGSYKVYVK
ncbi:MAG: T9SS type A sorting domain-containing protein [Tannerella sp.]|jgi:YD repeat-containing protein|nr:T9SS type A sorting domain-containing protein [Tannerella sp.]